MIVFILPLEWSGKIVLFTLPKKTVVNVSSCLFVLSYLVHRSFIICTYLLLFFFFWHWL